MARKRFLIDSRRRGQAMVEFALVLPLLLLLLFGILELGRLLFTYASVVNASRQAVRYGSATGYVTDATSPLRYADCAGIRAAAKNVSFGAGITDADVIINYWSPSGQRYGNQTNDVCPPTPGSAPNLFGPTGQILTGSRIEVFVTGHWASVVPGITGFSTRDLHSKSARTILSTIYLSGGPIGVSTASGGGYDVGMPSDTPTDTPTRTNTPTRTFTPSPTSSITPGPSPTASDTPTASATATITPTRTATPQCPVIKISETNPGSSSTYTVTFDNRGPVDVTATSILITWPLGKSPQIGLTRVQSSRGFDWVLPEINYNGSVTVSFASDPQPLNAGTSLSFTFTFSSSFPSNVNRGNVGGAMFVDPSPLQCGGPISY